MVEIRAKQGMEDVLEFLKAKKANLENEIRKEVAEREETINQAIEAVSYTVEVEDQVDEVGDLEELETQYN